MYVIIRLQSYIPLALFLTYNAEYYVLCLLQHLHASGSPAPTAPHCHSVSHQLVFGVRKVCLLVTVIVGRPAVRHQEVEDGRVVGDLWTSPAHHQSAAVYVLHLHVNGSAAAY